MKERLLKYRESNGLSIQEMAVKLNISSEEYEKIENGERQLTDEKLLKKIEELFPRKRFKTTTPYEQTTRTLNRLIPKNPAYEAIRKLGLDNFRSPAQEIISSQRTYLDRITVGSTLYRNKKYLGLPAGLDYLNWVRTPIDDFSNKRIREISTMQYLRTIDDSLVNRSINRLHGSWGAVNPFKETSQTIRQVNSIISGSYTKQRVFFNDINRAVVNNRKAYDKYIEFSSNLSRTLSDLNVLGFSKYHHRYFDLISETRTEDYLSGSVFKAFKDREDFNNEEEVIEEILKHPEYKEEVKGFFEELDELLDEDEEYDATQLEELYMRFSIWVSENIGKIYEDAELIVKVLFQNTAYIKWILGIYFSIQISMTNQMSHRNTQSIIKKNNKEINDELTQQSESIRQIFQNLESVNKGIANYKKSSIDNHLRTRRDYRSRMLGVVKKGQVVRILEMKTKWMRIAFEDFEDDIPKTGWVRIDYYEEIN